jgi:hypothetical protein
VWYRPKKHRKDRPFSSHFAMTCHASRHSLAHQELGDDPDFFVYNIKSWFLVRWRPKRESSPSSCTLSTRSIFYFHKSRERNDKNIKRKDAATVVAASRVYQVLYYHCLLLLKLAIDSFAGRVSFGALASSPPSSSCFIRYGHLLLSYLHFWHVRSVTLAVRLFPVHA